MRRLDSTGSCRVEILPLMGSVTVNQAEADRLKFALANLWFAANARPVLTVARLEAPILTGRLRRSHEIDVPRKDGRGIFVRLHAKTNYATIVYTGTSGSAPRPVRIRPGQIHTIRHTSTGRRSNHWFERAFQRLGFVNVRNFG